METFDSILLSMKLQIPSYNSIHAKTTTKILNPRKVYPKCSQSNITKKKVNEGKDGHFKGLSLVRSSSICSMCT